MFHKDPISLLAECAAADIRHRETNSVMTESQIVSAYRAIETVSEEVVYAPEMVPVLKIGNEFFTEMQYLAPYIQNNEISSVAEALDNIAEANQLPAKSVGLLIESQCAVTKMIDEALKKSGAVADKVMDKVKKGEALVDKLKGKGYNVKKKKDPVDEACGGKSGKGCKAKRSAKNEEGTNTGSAGPGENIDDTSQTNTVVDQTNPAAPAS